jgi:hypothetical protein
VALDVVTARVGEIEDPVVDAGLEETLADLVPCQCGHALFLSLQKKRLKT